MRYALGWARDNNLKVVPSCWFVRMLMDKEPEWQRLKAGS
ncbi:MAG: GNAT family N-acetyltransferase [Gemmatimonadales bacterium]